MVAGLVLGIESIPDSMASALLAAVNPIHGASAVMLATPVGALFASSTLMSVQTTSAMSLVVCTLAPGAYRIRPHGLAADVGDPDRNLHAYPGPAQNGEAAPFCP